MPNPHANLQSAARSTGVNRAADLNEKRSLAKTGMTVSMGVLAATGIMEGLGKRTGTVKTLHVVSGFALIGFSLWHYSLYRGQGRRA